MRAKILQIISGNFYIYLEETKTISKAKPLGVFRHTKKENKPMVGDNVIVEEKDDQYLIVEVLPRTCEIKRPKVANLDLLVLVVSWVQPNFNSLLLNKYLIYYEYYCPQVAIVFTKSDLVTDSEQIEQNAAIVQEYKDDGYLVFDANNPKDIQTLKDDFDKHIICFIGDSGVGKSTLINKLNPEFNLRTQAISQALNRGKHTTTTSILLPFLNGFLVDTPGFSTLELDLSPLQIARAFHDYYQWAPKCKFENCLHTPNAKECYVLEQVKQRKTSFNRYRDYNYILNEAKLNKK